MAPLHGPPGPLHLPDLILVAVVACALYWNTLDAGFCLDDTSAIKENQDLNSSITTIADVFRNDFWGTELMSNTSNKSYRPLTVLTYRWTHSYFGRRSAWAYHAGNIALYALCCVAWHVFVARRGLVSRGGCLASSLLFACHPMHVENGASIVGRADVLGMLFLLASIDAYLRAAGRGLAAGVAWFTIAAVLCVASMLSKELGMLSLGMGAAFDLILNARLLRWAVRDEAVPAATRGVAIRFVVALGVSIALLAVGRRLRGHRLSPSMSFIDNPIAFEDSWAVRVLMYTHVHAWYLLLLFAPLWSCADWGYNVLPQPDTPAMAIAAYAVVFGTPLAALRTEYREKIALCTVLLVVPFLPASGIVPVGTVLAERLLLIPSTGFALGGGLLYDWAAGSEVWAVAVRPPATATASAKKAKTKTKAEAKAEAKAKPTAAKAESGGEFVSGRAATVWGVLAALLAWYAALTVERSHYWHNPEALFAQGVRDCAGSAKGHLQVGTVAIQNGQRDKALHYFLKAAELHVNYTAALTSLGKLYGETNEHEKALEYHARAVAANQIHGANAETFLEHGKTLCYLKQCDKGIRDIAYGIKKAQKTGKMTTGMVGDFAIAWLMLENYEEAWKALNAFFNRHDVGNLGSGVCSWAAHIGTVASHVKKKVPPRAVALAKQHCGDLHAQLVGHSLV